MARGFKHLFRRSVLYLTIILMGACSRPSDPYPENRDIATVFATAGQETTTIDLSVELGSNCPTRLIGTPLSAELKGSSLILDHSQAIHEGIHLRFCSGDEAQSTVGVVWNVVQPNDAPAWPLSVSDDGHYLVDRKSKAILWNGGTAWSIAAEATRDEARKYLRDRSAKGVNVILVSLIEHLYSDGDPPWMNAYHHEPFSNYLQDSIPDMSMPAESYWQHVDWIIREAYANGITILAVPSYVGYQLGGAGWAKAMAKNGADRVTAYGEWLGKRYKTFPNIVWVMGGDWSASYEELDISEEVDALALGIIEKAKGHLMTAHGEPEHSARDDYDRPWLTINSVKSRARLLELVSTQYDQRPTLPTFLIESNYGNERGTTARQVRGQIYDAVLSGAFGHVYGNAPQWYFSAEVVSGFSDIEGLAWEQHLDDFGARSLPVFANLISQYPIHRLEPVLDNSIIRPVEVAAARRIIPTRYASNLAIAYLDQAMPVTVEFTVFSGDVSVTWVEAETGKSLPQTTNGPDEDPSLAPPGPGDWILILDGRAEVTE